MTTKKFEIINCSISSFPAAVEVAASEEGATEKMVAVERREVTTVTVNRISSSP